MTTDEEKEKEAVQKWADEEYSNPSYLHGEKVGYSIGNYEATDEAIRAYDAGEIDLWVAYQRPKTVEEWKEWEAEHGSFKDRWARPKPEAPEVAE